MDLESATCHQEKEKQGQFGHGWSWIKAFLKNVKIKLGKQDFYSNNNGCSAAREVWLQLVPDMWRTHFFTIGLLKWIKTNLATSVWRPQATITWGSLFGLEAWRLWKNRNFFVFQGITWSITETIETSICWARQYSIIHKWDPSNPSSMDARELLGDALGRVR